MFLEPKPLVPLAAEHVGILTELMKLDYAGREKVKEVIINAREEQILDEITQYIDTHTDEFFIFEFTSEQMANKFYADIKDPDATDYRFSIRRDMTYARITAIYIDCYDTVLLEVLDKEAVIAIHNYAMDVQNCLNACPVPPANCD